MGRAQIVKNLPAMQRPRFDHWIRKIPWRREWQPKGFSWTEELGSYSPWGHKESDTTEQLTLSLTKVKKIDRNSTFIPLNKSYS